jgi:hypothetical protein
MQTVPRFSTMFEGQVVYLPLLHVVLFCTLLIMLGFILDLLTTHVLCDEKQGNFKEKEKNIS